MGLCLSVALWKEKAANCRAAAADHRGFTDDVMLGGAGGGYGLLRDDGALDQEEEEAAAMTTPNKADIGAGGGTPLRPIWQRRVLMGVKCQLPTFSGIITYDERGQLAIRDTARDQEKHAAAITVLREML